MLDIGAAVGEETDSHQLIKVSTKYSREFLITDNMTLKYTVSTKYSE